MQRFTKISILIAGLWLGTFCLFVARQTPSTQLFSFLMTLVLLLVVLIGFVRIFTQWNRERWRSLIPLISCGLAVAVFPVSRSAILRLTFEHSLPRFESIICKLESGPLPDPSAVLEIAQVEDNTIYHAKAKQSPNGDLTVLFLTGNGFPVKHSGYLYSSSGTFSPSKDWPKVKEMKPNWFRISD